MTRDCNAFGMYRLPRRWELNFFFPIQSMNFFQVIPGAFHDSNQIIALTMKNLFTERLRATGGSGTASVCSFLS